MNPFKGSHNDTTKFLLPIMFPNFTHDQLFSNYFEEAYIGMLDGDDYDDTIILAYEEVPVPEDTPTDLNVLKVTDNYIVYEIPEELDDEYSKFLNGRYSELTEESKQKILNFWDEDESSILHGILYKTEIGKDTILNIVDKEFKDKIAKSLSKEKVEFWTPPNIVKSELYRGAE